MTPLSSQRFRQVFKRRFIELSALINFIVNCSFLGLGDDNYCTPQYPCGHGEGDCDSSADCEGYGAICGTCRDHKYPASVDCCFGKRPTFSKYTLTLLSPGRAGRNPPTAMFLPLLC